MPSPTLDDLKKHLIALKRLTEAFDAIDALREHGVITEAEEATLKIRLRAQLRDRIDAIPRDSN